MRERAAFVHRRANGFSVSDEHSTAISILWPADVVLGPSTQGCLCCQRVDFVCLDLRVADYVVRILM